MPKNIMSEELQKPSAPSQAINLSQVSVDTVRAEMARMSQSAAIEIHAEDAEMRESAALDIQAGTLSARQSAIGLLQAKDAAIHQSVIGMARAQQVTIQGNVGAALAERLEFGNAYAGIVAAREVHSEKIETILLLSGKVKGNVSAVMDTRGAIIAGLLGGVFAGMILLAGHLAFGKK
ncbi:MAG: hypothetical protein Fur002_21870 [Anaerolineales bacterium]